MATTMRNLNRLATTIRTASSFSTTVIRRQLIHQTASYSSSTRISNTFSYLPQSHWLLLSNINREVSRGRNCDGCNVSFSTDVSAARDFDEKEVEKSNKSYVPNDVVLYQFEACPFCNKVQAFLEYYDIPYKIVEVNPMNKKEIKWSDYKKVPILMVDGEKMVNSSDIIDKVYQRMHPDSVTEDAETQEWRRWVDDHLVHVLSPNIYRSPSEALESFDYITTKGNFSFTERLVAKYGGAAAMYFVSKTLKKRHNITDERRALYEAADKWVNALNGRQYLGGSEPNLADLSVFGVLRPIRNLKSGKDMVENTRIGDWFTRMENQMKPRRDTAVQGS